MTSNRLSITNHRVDPDKRQLLIDWSDGRQDIFPYLWLRHSHNFPLMGRAGQLDPREYQLPENPADLAIESISVQAQALVINWTHDGSISKHRFDQLRDASLRRETRLLRSHRAKLWVAKDALQFHWFDASDLEQPESRLQVFCHLRDYGIALVKGLPAEDGTLVTVAEHFGPVRQTHFGSLFDIRSRPEDRQGTGQDIGATSANSQSPHTDEGWRHAPPGFSLFHCIKSHDNKEGASIFVDGIGAAQALQKSDPDAFKFLSTVPLLFAAERNDQERFRSRARAIAVDSEGQIRGVRITDRTLPALDLDVDQIEPAYHAIGQFYRLLLSSERVFEVLLNPGEMVVFDNHRVLHGRRAFDPQASQRWLQQLSIDREEFQNQFRQLAETQGRDDISRWDQDAGALSQN